MLPHVSKSVLAQMGGELSTMIYTVKERLRYHFPFACLEAAETHIFHFSPIFRAGRLGELAEHFCRFRTYSKRVLVRESPHLLPTQSRKIRHSTREEKFGTKDVREEAFYVGGICYRKGNFEGCWM